MKKRNLYKDLVLCVLVCLLAAAVYQGIKTGQKERKSYGFTVTAQSAWTQQDVSELKKLRGILKFQPADSINVTVELDGYTLETELKGICLEDYPLKWQAAEQTYPMGNTPILFVGKDCFGSFADANGNKPGRSEIRGWTEGYQELQVTVTDETGEMKNARIGGILKNPDGSICMERGQMEEIWGRTAQAREGYIEIFGYSNMERAKEALMESGVVCGENSD